MAQPKRKIEPLAASTVLEVAAALRVIAANGFTSLDEARIFFSIAVAQIEGREHDVSSAAKLVGMPLSTFSRVAWGLHERGLLTYEATSSDRRRKYLRAARVAQ